jgi:hypothetical protein
MMKIVINNCHGGFGLSHQAIMRLAEVSEVTLVAVASDNSLVPWHYYLNEVKDENYWSEREVKRDNPLLVQVVEELGELANDRFSELKIVEVPDGVDWYIEEYDGLEWVAEQHRTWR